MLLKQKKIIMIQNYSEILLRTSIGSLFLLNILQLSGQVIGTSNPSLFIQQTEVLKDSFELSLDEYNELLINSNLDPISPSNPYVSDNNTIWMSYEIPAPEKGEDMLIPNIPSSNLEWQPFQKNKEAAPSTMNATSISGVDFDDNNTYNGSYYIPPDPSGAVGTTHVCHVVNALISCHTKAGAQASGFPDDLKGFFTTLNPENATFDPKILWDQYENRFVAITLVKTATISRILLAVSATADPTGTWYFQAIDAALSISSVDCWFDYPGFAVDDKAIYITGNYFQFSGGNFCDNRIIIIDKGVSGGIYSGVTSNDEDPTTNADFNIYDPSSSGLSGTHQPAHTFGTPPTNMGTYLTGYSGLSGGGNEFLQIIPITNPLSNPPTFGFSQLSMGNIDDLSVMGDADQLGNSTDIEVNDRRTLNAVWRGNKLWTTFQTKPSSGSNSGQTTAYWARLNASGTSPTFDNGGEIGGEDVVTGAITWMPSIVADANNDAGVVFSVSHSTMYAGVYAVGIDGTTNNITSSQLVKAGVDDYVRIFASYGGTQNRWGDYSRMAIDPSNGNYWAIHEAPIANGTVIDGEDGRWQVFLEELQNLLLPVELISFTISSDENNAILEWTTQTESNNEGFEIELFDGQQFQKIGFQKGEGNSVKKVDYTFTVYDLDPGDYIFRLRQIDYDGTESISDARSVHIRNNNRFVISDAFPNPFSDQTSFTVLIDKPQNVEIKLYDFNSRLVKDIFDGILYNESVYPFNILGEGLPNGVYTIRIVGEDFSRNQKILLKN